MRKNLVDWTTLPNGYVVSTIERSEIGQTFDSLLQTFIEAIVGDTGRADLAQEGDYETMVFPFADGEISDWCELDFARYENHEEALEGHARMVTRWKEMPAGIAREPFWQEDEAKT